jgi:hypothetical protein
MFFMRELTTQSSSNVAIFVGVLNENVLFQPLTLKMTVKVMYFQSQNIKSPVGDKLTSLTLSNLTRSNRTYDFKPG